MSTGIARRAIVLTASFSASKLIDASNPDLTLLIKTLAATTKTITDLLRSSCLDFYRVNADAFQLMKKAGTDSELGPEIRHALRVYGEIVFSLKEGGSRASALEFSAGLSAGDATIEEKKLVGEANDASIRLANISKDEGSLLVMPIHLHRLIAPTNVPPKGGSGTSILQNYSFKQNDLSFLLGGKEGRQD